MRKIPQTMEVANTPLTFCRLMGSILQKLQETPVSFGKLVSEAKRLLRFGAASIFATSIDYIIFICLTSLTLSSGYSNLHSQFAGMIVNFYLQKKYVFVLRRRLASAFLLSLLFSAVGLIIGTTLIYYLTLIPIFRDRPILAKVPVTVVVFLFNYISKKYAFGNG